MTDLATWKRDTAVRRFGEIRADMTRAGIGMSDERIAGEVGRYVDAKATDVLRWVRAV